MKQGVTLLFTGPVHEENILGNTPSGILGLNSNVFSSCIRPIGWHLSLEVEKQFILANVISFMNIVSIYI